MLEKVSSTQEPLVLVLSAELSWRFGTDAL
jgi:hypothetical protein